jgi:plastocyanin
VRVRRVVACVVSCVGAIAGPACRERSTTSAVRPDDVTSAKDAKSAKTAPKNGRIVGKVRWNGVPPLPMPPAGATGACASVPIADVVVGVDGGLADTLVRVMPGTLPTSPSVATSAKIVSTKACAFEPLVAILEPGQEVAFENEDTRVRNVHAFDLESAESIFDTKVAPRASTTMLPATIAPLADAILVMSDDAPWMRALLWVGDPQWSRITGKTGEFAIDDVPPGEHDVQAYHDGGDTMHGQIRHVVVPADGAAIRVDFVYPRP